MPNYYFKARNELRETSKNVFLKTESKHGKHQEHQQRNIEFDSRTNYRVSGEPLSNRPLSSPHPEVNSARSDVSAGSTVCILFFNGDSF